MSLKLCVGVSRKVGRPDYGSLGASCGVEVELDASLIWSDPAAFRARAREAYSACEAVVREQLGRAGEPGPPDHDPGRGARDGARPPRETPPSASTGRRDRPATPAQLRALGAMARRGEIDLGAVVAGEFGVTSPDALSARQASGLIGRLRGEPARA
jgi:hypothetical protein